MEEWRDIPGFAGRYQASSEGQIRSVSRLLVDQSGNSYLKKGRIISSHFGSSGYLQVGISMIANRPKTFMVHSLVARTFVGPRPDGYDICHSDGQKDNNSVENLRYDTRSANLMDEVRRGTNHHASKTECKWGHAFSEKNVSIRVKSDGLSQRVCLACGIMRQAFRRDSRLNPQEKLALDPKWAARI